MHINPEDKKQYDRRYHEEHRQRISEQKKEYYRKNREKILTQVGHYRKNNPEKKREWDRKSYWDDVEKSRERSRQYSRKRREINRQRLAEWRKANREKDREGARRRYRAAPEKDIIKVEKRRAYKQSVANTFTIADWQRLLFQSPHCHWCKRAWTRIRRPTHDHVIPLSSGGPNTLENSCCACGECNSRKRNRRVNPMNGQGILL